MLVGVVQCCNTTMYAFLWPSFIGMPQYVFQSYNNKMLQRLDKHSIHAYVIVARAIVCFELFNRGAGDANKGNPHFIPLHEDTIVLLYCCKLHY